MSDSTAVVVDAAEVVVVRVTMESGAAWARIGVRRRRMEGVLRSFILEL